MNRSTFRKAYREARVSLGVFSDATQPAATRREAEGRWAGIPEAARVALSASFHLPGSVATAAVYDARHCGGTRKSWYLKLARRAG